jgi:hypothetical protein
MEMQGARKTTLKLNNLDHTFTELQTFSSIYNIRVPKYELHVWQSQCCTLQQTIYVPIVIYPTIILIVILSYCTMLGVLDHFWPPVVSCYSTEDTVWIGNWFIYNPHT